MFYSLFPQSSVSIFESAHKSFSLSDFGQYTLCATGAFNSYTYKCLYIYINLPSEMFDGIFSYI